MEYCFVVWLFLGFFETVIGDCPRSCLCVNSIMECYEELPESVPKHTLEVTIHKAPFDKRFNFTGEGWRNVRTLSINPWLSAYQNTQKEVSRDLYEYEFEGLENLQKMQIACRCLKSTRKNSFGGLNGLKILDLRNNEQYRLSSIQNIFGSNSLSNLSELYISNSSNHVQNQNSLELGSDFFSVIKNVPLKRFDISNTPAWISSKNEGDVSTAFPLLEQLNLSATGRILSSMSEPFYGLHTRRNETSFKRLESIDVSYPYIQLDFSDAVMTSGWWYHSDVQIQLPLQLAEVYIKGVLKRPGKIPYMTANLTHLCIWKAVNASKYIICFNGRGDSLKKLALAENSITYIDPVLFDYAPNLQYLDLSSNSLREMISEGLILSMANKVQTLEVLILSHNEIDLIPDNSFTGLKSLKVLDLSHNKIETIHFHIFGLSSLTEIDLSFNNMVVLDEFSIKTVNYLLSEKTINCTEKTIVKLKGNPFVCSCDSLNFIYWLSDLNETFVCMLDSQKQKVDFRTIQQIEYSCRRNIVIVVFCIYATVVVVLFAIMGRVLCLTHKRNQQKRNIMKAIELYRAIPDKERVPVFLSFSSEDDHIVMGEIYPNLEKGLQTILKTELPCVETGYSAFRPGYALANEIIRCVEASYVVVFFVTNTFCRKQWCKNETLIAHYENKPIILMLWEEIDMTLMPRYLHKHYTNHARVHWVEDENGQRRMSPGWDKLCKVIVSKFAQNQNEAEPV